MLCTINLTKSRNLVIVTPVLTVALGIICCVIEYFCGARFSAYMKNKLIEARKADAEKADRRSSIY